MTSVLWRCWMGGRKSIRPVKNGGWRMWALVSPDGVAPSRMVGACPLLLIFPFTIKSRSSLLAPAHLGGPAKRIVEWLWRWYINNHNTCNCTYCKDKQLLQLLYHSVRDATEPARIWIRRIQILYFKSKYKIWICQIQILSIRFCPSDSYLPHNHS